MAGDTATSRIVYLKDERGVILDGAVVVGDDDVPDGYEESTEYESLKFTEKEAAPVDESKLTVSDKGPDIRQTIDVIKGDTQEGPSDPAGLEDNGDYELPEGGPQPGDEIKVGESRDNPPVFSTIDEVKDESDTQEGPSDPGGEESDDGDPDGGDKPKSRRSSRK